MEIPFEDFGGAGEVIHFAHANAYHPRSYTQLIRHFLPDYRVKGMLFRPFWEGSKTRSAPSWRTYARDLIHFLEQKNAQQIIGIGHSLGAITTLLAAAERPDLFQKIILIEPVILAPRIYRFTALTPPFIRRRMIPPAKIASRRRDTWSSKEEAYQYLRSKRVFREISDTVFQDVIEHGINQVSERRAQLAFSKEWEAHIYSSTINPWRAIRKLNTPFLVIKGENTNVISDEVWRELQKVHPGARYLDITGTTHLVPLERPQLIAEEIINFIKT